MQKNTFLIHLNQWLVYNHSSVDLAAEEKQCKQRTILCESKNMRKAERETEYQPTEENMWISFGNLCQNIVAFSFPMQIICSCKLSFQLIC